MEALTATISVVSLSHRLHLLARGVTRGVTRGVMSLAHQDAQPCGQAYQEYRWVIVAQKQVTGNR